MEATKTVRAIVRSPLRPSSLSRSTGRSLIERIPSCLPLSRILPRRRALLFFVINLHALAFAQASIPGPLRSRPHSSVFGRPLSAFFHLSTSGVIVPLRIFMCNYSISRQSPLNTDCFTIIRASNLPNFWCGGLPLFAEKDCPFAKHSPPQAEL